MRKNKLYNRIVKKYRKKLMKQVKQSTPFDYDGLYLFVTFLRYMLEYYVTKDNVHALEIEGHDRVEMLSKALNEFDSWRNCDTDYYDELLNRSESMLDEDVIDLLLENERKKEQHWNNFWTIIKDEFLYWWD